MALKDEQIDGFSLGFTCFISASSSSRRSISGSRYSEVVKWSTPNLVSKSSDNACKANERRGGAT